MGRRKVQEPGTSTKALALIGPAMVTLGVLGIVPVRDPEVVEIPWQFRVVAALFLLPGIWLSRRAYAAYRRAWNALPSRPLSTSAAAKIDVWHDLRQTLLAVLQLFGGVLLPMGLIAVIVGLTEDYPVLATVGAGFCVVGVWSFVSGFRRYRRVNDPARQLGVRLNPMARALRRQWELLATTGVFATVIPVAAAIFLINLA